MDLGITGKTALVLGGGEGLGQAISTVLASEGANIAIADIDQNSIAGTEAAAKACNGSPSGHWRFHQRSYRSNSHGRPRRYQNRS
jgi:3-oxoacyl-[acyl-carrier protein] reductase